MRVFAMRVFVADAAIGPVNHQFRLLIARNWTRGVNGLRLRIVLARGALITFALYDPVVAVFDDVLTFSHAFEVSP